MQAYLSEGLSEGLGTFILCIVILANGDPIMIAVALLIGILIANIASPAHLNPAVTLMKLLEGKVTNNEAMLLVGSQLAAAVLAVYWWNQVGNKKLV